MAPIVVVIIIVVMVAAFIMLRQQGNHHEAIAVWSLGGGTLGLIAFFWMPWMRIGGLGTLLEPVTRGLTGWVLVTNIPTISDTVRMTLYLALVASLAALVGGGLCFIKQSSARMTGMIQAGMNALAVLLLLFSMKSIRMLGLDVGVGGVDASDFIPGYIGPGLGIGFWMMLVAAGLGIAGGIAIQNTPPVRSDRRKTRPARKAGRPGSRSRRSRY